MTTISEAVDQVKTTAMKLAEVRKELIAAKEILERAKEQESAARGQYALALNDLEKQTGADL